MEYQVRTYKIADGRMDEWLSGWSEGVRPLREQLGFRVVGAWSLIDTNEFVWVLAYDGPDSFEAAGEFGVRELGGMLEEAEARRQTEN